MAKAPVRKNLLNELISLFSNKGCLSAKDICNELGISQQKFSLLVKEANSKILKAGKASKTKYAYRRSISRIEDPILVFSIDEEGKASELSELYPILERGFLDLRSESEFSVFDDIPYYLEDIKPSGFLGKLVPQQHPNLACPKNIADWSNADILYYLSQFGSNCVGNLVLGEDALRIALQKREQSKIINKPLYYDQQAANILSQHDLGSSAMGEQPKFIVNQGIHQFIVKFSPGGTDEIAKRRADLLVAEHIALEVLLDAGVAAAKSTIVQSKSRTFLELKRFDRTEQGGRRGLISLASLLAEHIGSLENWTKSTRSLSEGGFINLKDAEKAAALDIFGELISNTDRHNWNLSFFYENYKVKQIAPCYDMLPMRYAPQNGEIVERTISTFVPTPKEEKAFTWAHPIAKKYWKELSKDTRVSKQFRKIAINHYDRLV